MKWSGRSGWDWQRLDRRGQEWPDRRGTDWNGGDRRGLARPEWSG